MNETITDTSPIFSLRIVSVDSYMKAPLFGLDACYSEFRAEEVKQVSGIYCNEMNDEKKKIHSLLPCV